MEELERLVKCDEKHLMPKLWDIQGAMSKRFISSTIHSPGCLDCGGDGYKIVDREERGRMVSRAVPCGCSTRVMVDRKNTPVETDGEGVSHLPKAEQDRIARRVMGQLGAPSDVKRLTGVNEPQRRNELQSQKTQLLGER